MNLNYIYAESTVEPSAIEIGSKVVFLRTDIESVDRTDEDGNVVTYWTYQEAVLTADEFNSYASELQSVNAVKGINNADNILSILSAQVSGDNNQMVIMEAIADLYAAIIGNS